MLEDEPLPRYTGGLVSLFASKQKQGGGAFLGKRLGLLPISATKRFKSSRRKPRLRLLVFEKHRRSIGVLGRDESTPGRRRRVPWVKSPARPTLPRKKEARVPKADDTNEEGTKTNGDAALRPRLRDDRRGVPRRGVRVRGPDVPRLGRAGRGRSAAAPRREGCGGRRRGGVRRIGRRRLSRGARARGGSRGTTKTEEPPPPRPPAGRPGIHECRRREVVGPRRGRGGRGVCAPG